MSDNPGACNLEPTRREAWSSHKLLKLGLAARGSSTAAGKQISKAVMCTHHQVCDLDAWPSYLLALPWPCRVCTSRPALIFNANDAVDHVCTSGSSACTGTNLI